MKKLVTVKSISIVLIISLLLGIMSLMSISSSAASKVSSISYSTQKKEIDPEDHYDYDPWGFDKDLWDNFEGPFFDFPVEGDLLTVYYENGTTEIYEYLVDYGMDEWSVSRYQWVNVNDANKIIPSDDVTFSEIPYSDFEHNTVLTATYKNHSANFNVTIHNQVEKVTKKASLTQDGQIRWYCDGCNKTFNTYSIDRIKTVSLSKTTFVYNGKVQRPNVKIYDSVGNSYFDKNVDYKVTYSSGCKNVGTYSVKITFVGNFYQGSVVKKFKILPKGTILYKLTAGKKAFTAKWSRHGGITGYQIQYSTNARFTGAKTVTVKGAISAGKAIKNLKAKQVYYVRVRTYKTIAKANYCSAWSKAYKVKTK